MVQGEVVAGGGSGSGSGDGDGKDGDDKENAGDGKGGNDADGGGDGAGGCGPGSSSHCPKHSPSGKAGDPVDIATGRVSTSSLDLGLAGLLPLFFNRTYSSTAHRRDVGLGWGWTHSLGWQLERRGRATIEVWDDGGTMMAFPTPTEGDRSSAFKGWVLHSVPGGFELEFDGRWWVFGEPDADDRLYRLLAIRDRNGNQIRLTYTNGCLSEILDSVGRIVRVRATPERRIAALEVKNGHDHGQWISFARYVYDERGNLVSVTDAGGFTTTYTYEEDGLLASHAEPDSLVFHFRYDREGRCVETWGAMPGGGVPGLIETAPALLADGVTRAKGILHCRLTFGPKGLVEVADCAQVRRYSANRFGLLDKTVSGSGVTTRQFDERGYLVAATDPLGATYRFARDERGRIVSETDPLGYTTTTQLAPDGQPLEVRDALGIIARFAYDALGNMTAMSPALGEVASFRYDDRGALIEVIRPNGGRVTFAYDDQYNLARVVEADGRELRWTHDAFGRITSVVEAGGTETRYAYDDRGLRVATYQPNGNVFRSTFNGARDEISASDAERSIRAEYNGFHQLTRLVYSNGETMRFLYDRDANLVQTINENGDARTVKRDLDGIPLEIVSYDGRTERFKYDAVGNLVRYENGAGEVTEYKLDLLGRILEVTYADDTSAKFELDARGQVIRESYGGVEMRYELDAAGQRIRELQSVDGTAETLERSFDIMRGRVALRTSRGHEERWARDALGRVERRFLDPSSALHFGYDSTGREVGRALPGGARIESAWTTEHKLRQIAVLAPSAAARGDVPEPEWVGALPPNATVFKAFAYSPAGRLATRWDKDRGSQEYKYDGRDRLLDSLLNGQPSEAFRYDGADNVSELGPARTYSPGNVLRGKGPFTFDWDADGRLRSKTQLLSDGSTRATRYEWSAAGFLAAVSTPDGRRVEFTYDPYGRRMTKSVWRVEGDGARTKISNTRYVWDGPTLVHDIRQTSGDDPVVEERTYCFDERLTPVAHRTSTKSTRGTTVSDWVYYVTDPIGTPEALVTGGGQVVGTVQHTTWGVTTSSGTETTPLRFAGQYEDSETGLHYNRYRYYDPEIGRYISQDPAGGPPHPNLYRYAHNPVLGIDPYGLHTVNNATWNPGDGSPPVRLGNNGTLDSSFDPTTRKQMQQSGMTPNASLYKSLATPEGKMGSDACGMAFNKEHFSDTEAKACRQAGKLADKPGGTLRMTGELPPCSHCQERMRKFAKDNQAKVVYKPGLNGEKSFVVDHRPGAKPGKNN